MDCGPQQGSVKKACCIALLKSGRQLIGEIYSYCGYKIPNRVNLITQWRGVMFSSERLKGLDVFVCVAETGSFTAAAERLNVTRSAISKAISRLEARLDTRLFNRTTRRLALTDAGVRFYRTCTNVLGELEEAELSLHAHNTEPMGRVRIDLPAAYGRLHALGVILRCVEAHELLVPHISFSDRYVDPVEEDIDIVVRIGGSNIWPPTLGRRYLGTERLVFCASPAYVLKQGAPKTAHDLEHHRCVMYGRADGQVNPWYFAGPQGGSERRLLPAHLTVGDGEGQVAAVLAGHGIAQLPTWLVKQPLAEGKLVEVLAHLATEGSPVNLVWLKRREAQPKVSVLLEALGAALAP